MQGDLSDKQVKQKLIFFLLFSDKDYACIGCSQALEDCIHLFWSYPRWFWSNVFDTLGNALNVELSPNTLPALFH